ncbi:MAG: hypothetical protein HUU47_07475 [Bacteroidetes bacterium]|nr:hypothetical protein [Bacteroidota bacterium]
MLLKKTVNILFFSFNTIFSYSQIDNSNLFSANTDSILKPQTVIGFVFENTNYLKNTEYKSNIEQGATWAGSQFHPQIVLKDKNKFSFKAGIFIQKDFGNNSFRNLIPTYTFSYATNNIKVNFGTLEGSLDHNLIEPIYAIENYIDKRIENGLQFKGKYKKLTFDNWIDWEKMIYRTSKTQEIFTTGFCNTLNIFNNDNFKLNVPVQIIARHHGGEIYAYPHVPIKTQFDFAYGTSFKFLSPKNKKNYLKLDVFFTFYEDLSPTKADSFFDGTGQFITLSYKKNNTTIMINYWDAHQYISPLAEPILVSKSREYPGIYIQYRKMAMFRLFYEIKKKNTWALVARVNNIYDFSEKSYNNSVDVFFKYNFGYSFRSRRLL